LQIKVERATAVKVYPGVFSVLVLYCVWALLARSCWPAGPSRNAQLCAGTCGLVVRKSLLKPGHTGWTPAPSVS